MVVEVFLLVFVFVFFEAVAAGAPSGDGLSSKWVRLGGLIGLVFAAGGADVGSLWLTKPVLICQRDLNVSSFTVWKDGSKAT